MKKLSDVTFEDAIAILSVCNYANFFRRGKWVLLDTTLEIGEPSKKLYCRTKRYIFWFQNDAIDMDVTDLDSEFSFDDSHFDVKYTCYIKAAQLGYYVPGLTELIK